MATQKPDHQAQTQPESQPQSGYNNPSPSASSPGGSTRTPSPSSPSSPGGSASSALPLNQLKKAIAVAVLALGMAVGAYWIAAPVQDPEPTQEQIEARAQHYQQQLAQLGNISVQPVQDRERTEALATFANQDRQRLEQTQAPLAWITFWDTMAEDGDVVRVTSDGVSQEVLLRREPTRVAVPVPPSGRVAVTGSYDGGGGITVGIISGSQRIPIPYMRVGQVINIPVSVTP